MPTTLSISANEKSTIVITVACADEDGSAVTPVSATWTLTDVDGTVINSRSSVSLTPAASMDVVLYGSDLAFQTGESGTVKRVLTIETTYNSDAGSNLPHKDQATFDLEDLAAVS